MIDNSEHNWVNNYQLFNWLIFSLMCLIGLFYLLKIFSKAGGNLTWQKTVTGLIALLLIYASSFNIQNQFRAEFILNVELKALKTKMDTDIVSFATYENNLDGLEKINSWVIEYQKIMSKFSVNYTDSFKIPEVNPDSPFPIDN